MSGKHWWLGIVAALSCSSTAREPVANRTSGAGSGDAGADAAQLADAAVRFPCESPERLGGGVFRCGGGFLHLAAVEPAWLPASEVPGGCAADSYCLATADCTGDSTCGAPVGSTSCTCSAACVTEPGCENVVCVPSHDPDLACFRANCRSDADCAGGALCTSYVQVPHSYPDAVSDLGFLCQGPDDECAGDGDCDGGRCLLYRTVRRCMQLDGAVSRFPW